MGTHSVVLFFKALFKHWWVLMSCAAFTFLGIWTAYASKGREWLLWSSGLLAVVFLAVAAYRTWLTEHRRLLETMNETAETIRSLKEELARKHPHDEQAETAVRKAISKLDDAEVRFLGWLLQMERPGQGIVQRQGYRGASESILEKTSTLLVGFESVRPGNGLVEIDRIYYVNPKSEQAIKNVLFPLPRTTHSQGN
jgi:hypothetical protein